MKKFAILDFLSPLVDAMTKKTPSERPTVHEASALFKKIVSEQKEGLAEEWLVPLERNWLGRLIDSVASYYEGITLHFRNIFYVYFSRFF